MSKKNTLIEQDLILFLEKSNDQWAIKDKESRYLFINQSAFRYYGIPIDFDYLGCSDSELPHPAAELAEEFQKNDKIIITEERTITEIETHLYGADRRLQPHICKKSPFYDENNQCIGIICQGMNITSLPIASNFFEKKPKLLSTSPPLTLFTNRELDIIFWAQHRLSYKEIAKRLNIAPRTVNSRLQLIYEKANVHSMSQFINYCQSMGFDQYIPTHLLRKGVIVINNKK